VTTLSQGIAEQLAQDVIGGRLRPGAKLDEVVLAGRFKVSRSPIRDALRQLAATGLLEFKPRRGFSVVSIDVPGLLDLFEAASEVEGLCAKLCAMRVGMAEKRQIELLHKRALLAVAKGNADEYAALNEAFHHAIYSGARNRTLSAIAINLRQRLTPFRSQDFFSSGNRMKSSAEEHDVVVRAINASDADAAFEGMRRHTASTATNVIEYFERHGRSGAPAKQAARNAGKRAGRAAET
jgi:DNA-binding GntR family transcriptional regulator